MENTINQKVVLSDIEIKKAVNRNMILLLMGQLVSQFGSSVYSFAIGLYILKVTGSGLNFALTIALGTLPRVVFGPISGIIADRFDRKKLVVSFDILSGLVVLSLLGISMIDSLRLSYIYIATILLTTCNTFFNTPLGSSMPNIVDDENLTRVNSLSQAIQSVSSIAGPSLGGLFFILVDIKLFLFVNGLSFIFSGISEMFIDFNLKSKINGKIENENKEKINIEPKKSFLEDFKEGIKYVGTQRWLVIFSSFVIFFNLFTIMGLTIPVPYIVNQIWDFSPQQYGLLNMTFPVGMLVGALILSVLPEAKSNFKRIMLCILTFSVVIFSVGIITSELLFTLSNGYYLIILMVQFAFISISAAFINIPISVTLQRLIPDEMRGRVFGTLGTLGQGLIPLGAIIAGILVDKINPWMMPIATGVIMLILTFFMYRVEELKSI